MQGLLEAPQDNESMEKVKSLFQAGYKMLYEGGAFDALRQQAEENPVGAVTQFLSTTATQILQDAGETDTTTVLSAMMGLLGEVVQALEETGIKIPPEQVETIIGSAINQTLTNIPELGQSMVSDPQVQQALQEDPRVQEELAQRQQPQQQGLLGVQ